MSKTYYYVAFSCAYLILLASAAHGAVGVSNIGIGDPDQLFPGGASTSFTTGNLASILSSITIDVENGVPDGDNYLLALWSDAGGHPGSILESYAPQTLSDVPPVVIPLTFTSAGLSLDPHTTYWVVVNPEPSPGYWASTEATGETSDDGWTIGNTSLYGSSPWTERLNDPHGPVVGLMSVEVTFVPEPTSLGILGMSLIFLIQRRSRTRSVC